MGSILAPLFINFKKTNKMFKDLRPNAPFFVLHRGEKPVLETGSIVSVSQPVPKMPTNYNAMYPQQPEMVVDVRVKVGTNTLTFEKLPANNAIADFSSNGQSNVVVASNRDMIRTEIETMHTQSKGIIDSLPYHQSVMSECESILKTINPSYAKEKEQENEIKGLNAKISELEKKLGGIDDIKQMLSNISKSNNNTKKE